MKIEQWSPEKLVDYARNPRKNDHAVERVAAAIREFGFRVPIIAKSDGLVVDGHLRLKAARKLGLASVPVVLADDMSETQIKAFRISVNRMAELAEWDTELLALEMEDLRAAGIDAEMAGFSDGELEALSAQVEPEQKNEAKEIEEDEPPEVQEQAITRAGDVWLLGNHRVMCGDSTKADDVARLMAGAKADMVLTDPPYGVSYVGKTKDALKVENDGLKEDALTRLVCDAFDNAEANCRAGSYWYATVPDGPLIILFAHDWKRRGILRQIMVWAKNAMVFGSSEYHYQHEPILFGWVPGKRHKNSDRTRTTLWKYDRPQSNREHPTMKPVALWGQAVQDGSREDEIIYDPFLGSGTTVIAAEQLGRKCYGMEISPQYCDVIVKRWQTLTGKQATRESDGITFDDARSQHA